MRRSFAVATAAVAAGTALTPILVTQTSADAPAAPAAAAPAQPVTPTVVSSATITPQRVMRLTSRFRPPGFPSPSYVLGVIAKHEASRWRVPYWRLRCRIAGESYGGKWRATNGQYVGVGQFAWSTFARGVRSIGTRRVVLERRRVRLRRVRIRERMSDGTKRTRYGRAVRQLVIVRQVGKLPRNPPHRHTWVQVRIMAQAMAGVGGVNDSEWEVRC